MFRIVKAIGLLLLFLLMLGTLPGVMQPPSAQAQEEMPPAEETRSSLPVILLYLQRPADSPERKKDDPNNLLQAALTDSLDRSERYQVLGYRPTHPLIRRALKEKLISAADLTAQPLAPETLQRLGEIVGARFVLVFGGSLDADALRTDVRFEERMGTLWRTVVAQRLETPTRIGKQKLKIKEVTDLATDSIVSQMGLPFRRAEALGERLAKAQGMAPVPAAPEKPARPAKSEKPDKPETKPETTGKTDPKPDKPQPEPKQAQKSTDKPVVRTPQDTEAKPVPSANSMSALPSDPKLPANPKKPALPETAPRLDPEARANAGFNSGNAARRPVEPTIPDIAPAPAPPKPDNEALIAQYRRTGDLANVIVSLRRAIDAKPRDPDLRRQLVLAYQERQMPDAALSELERALLLTPGDVGLLRLRGDALLSKGDTALAIKAYQNALNTAPDDVNLRVALGDALLLDNQFPEALQTYQAATKAAPTSALPHRRLARALLARASKEAAQYAASLEQVRLAREKTPPADVEVYTEDYLTLMRIVDARLQDVLGEVLATNAAVNKGQRTPKEAADSVTDMKTRTESLSEYLDKLPPAPSKDSLHARYQQSAVLILQTLARFKEMLASPADERLQEAYESARLDALRELTSASRRLKEPRRPADNTP